MPTRTLVDTDSVQIVQNKWLDDVRQYQQNVDTLWKHGTINAALTNIGTSTQTTIVVTENTAVNANTDLTNYPNIHWLFLGAGRLTTATGVSLILYSAATITAPQQNRILDATVGTITFAVTEGVYSRYWGTGSVTWLGYGLDYTGDGTNGPVRITKDSKVMVGVTSATGMAAGEIALANAKALRCLNGPGDAAIAAVYVDAASRVLLGSDAYCAGVYFAPSNVSPVQILPTNGAAIIEFGGEASSDPAAPSANAARLYIKDNGSGKTQLCVRFASGAVQVLATEP